jgi:hypothetical protein
MRIKPAILCIAGLALMASSFAQSRRFSKDWEREVLPFGSGNWISLCVDRNGAVQVISLSGYWVTLSPSGSVLTESSDLDAVGGATSVACASDGSVVIGNHRSQQLHIFSGDHKLLSSLTATQGFATLVAATPTSVIALGTKKGTLFRHMTLNRASGQAEFAFDGGPLPDQLASGISGMPGDATFDAKQDQLLFVTRNPEHVLVYSRNGELLRFKTIAGAVRPNAPQQDIFTFTGPYDQAAGIFPIANGYVVTVSRQDRSPHAISGRLSYQFLDKDLNVTGYDESPQGIGTIVASDGNGTVYGIAGGENFRVLKGHLE